ncbi:uncharacterized protein LTR77_005116 [Saxophila tyrrhenica]|uniref:Oxidoreductase n=1 Tax=Saxophila tyrrhenica TaxID=1690608 RepID=A0AAV9PFC6_9PEZI|nr:hypothetical protein LTR77_005116 [Saxophila tyrrhenica]
MGKVEFDAAKEIPDLSSKVILITGGTAGLGYETAVSFAAHNPDRILFTGRSQSSADKLIEDVNSRFPNVAIDFVKCDLASLETVRSAAKEVLAKTKRLDLVFANAGVMALPPGLTKDGFEIQFGTNHMGNAHMVNLLTPLMESTAKRNGDVRVIWNTSQGYMFHPKGGILFDKVKTTQEDIAPVLASWGRYGQSKLANILYARAFAKHYPSITSVVIHPGISATGLVTNLNLASKLFVYATTMGNRLPPEQCAWNQQWAATAPLGTGDRQVESGGYYEPVGAKAKLQGESGSDELAERLWNWTHEELKGYKL